MKIATSIPELQSTRSSLSSPVGLVPTMGYLHAGHISLVRRAREECASVVVSIFVNPAQFGPREDLDKYPRNLPRDLSLLEAEGVDLVWNPTNEIVYPPGFQTWVSVDNLTRGLEGAVRPGHFRGVSTVVSILFNSVQPQKAYFGQKDAQQVAVIRQMTKDLCFPIGIVVCPTIREKDGLALSSRNTFLSPEERKAAPVLFRSLNSARIAYENGEKRAEKLRQIIKDVIEAEPCAKLQYVSCADYDTLEELETINCKTLLSMAVYLGTTRLIDNLIIGEEG